MVIPLLLGLQKEASNPEPDWKSIDEALKTLSEHLRGIDEACGLKISNSIDTIETVAKMRNPRMLLDVAYLVALRLCMG